MNQPPLLPIFRSKHQLAILSELLINASRAFTVPDLVRATGASQPTVWREVERLSESGLVTTKAIGRTKLVQANLDSPYFPALSMLTTQLMGPLVWVRRRLDDVPGIRYVYIFGSWARRYQGEPGRDPADVDVLVVGEADPDAVDDALADLPDVLGRPVNAVIVSEEDWRAGKSAFLRQVKREPLVQVAG